MNTLMYKEVKEKLEKLKKNIPYLEANIDTKNIKGIEDSVSYLMYILHRIHKKATGKGTAESIQDLVGRIWWLKRQREMEKKERKFMKVDKLYNEWSKVYDSDANLLIFLEENVSDKYIGNVNGKEVLDYGCGTGRYAIPLAKKGANVTAIDFSKGMLNIAKKKAQKSNVKIDFIQQDITKYSPDKKFDLIISMLVLDHIQNLKTSIDIIEKSSKIGTKVVISNVHPECLRKNVNLKTGKAEGFLRDKRKTNQFYHSLSEYLDLFLEKGFVLTKIDNLVYEKKFYSKPALAKRFKTFAGIKNNELGIIMRFEKVR